jgi:uncharacterized membrane protein
MDLKRFLRYETLIWAFMGAFMGVSVSSGNIAWALGAIAICLPIYYKLRKRVDEVVEDEMMFKLSEKASHTAFRIFAPIAAFTGLVIVTLKDIYPQYLQIGLTLAFSACSLLVIYIAAIKYYMKKGV